MTTAWRGILLITMTRYLVLLRGINVGGRNKVPMAALRELQVHGSGVLLRWLLERDLVDELNLRVYPVVLGDGLRLFPERGQTHNLQLVESRSLPSGVMLETYQPAGRATFGNAGAQ